MADDCTQDQVPDMHYKKWRIAATHIVGTEIWALRSAAFLSEWPWMCYMLELLVSL